MKVIAAVKLLSSLCLMCIPPCRLAKKGRKQAASRVDSDEDSPNSGCSFSLCGDDSDEAGSTDCDAAEIVRPEPSGRRKPAAAARQPVTNRVAPKPKGARAGVQKGRQNFVRMDKKVCRVLCPALLHPIQLKSQHHSQSQDCICMQGGSGKFGFKSKAGMKRKPAGKGRFGHRYAPK